MDWIAATYDSDTSDVEEGPPIKHHSAPQSTSSPACAESPVSSSISPGRSTRSWDETHKGPTPRAPPIPIEMTENHSHRPYRAKRHRTAQMGGDGSEERETEGVGKAGPEKGEKARKVSFSTSEPPSGVKRKMSWLNTRNAPIVRIHWQKKKGRSLIGIGMDGFLRLWQPFVDHSLETPIKVRAHSLGIRDGEWTCDGCNYITGSVDHFAKVWDLETFKTIHSFDHGTEKVSCVRCHPNEPNLFLTGSYRSTIRLFDMRSGRCETTYTGMVGQILSLEFHPDGEMFVASSDEVSSASLDRAVVVYDLKKPVIISNQIYLETFTCPCIRMHPKLPRFVMQSNGNYIAIFLSVKPFKMIKKRRFEEHFVNAFPVQCCFNRDGSLLLSGSSDGHVVMYGWEESRSRLAWRAHESASVGIDFHPHDERIVASSSWDGEVCLWEVQPTATNHVTT